MKTTIVETAFLTLGLALYPLTAHAQTVSGQQPTQPVSMDQVDAQPSHAYGATAAGTSMFAPMSDRLISDPLFLPLKGQVFGTTSYTYGNQTGDRYNSIGTRTSSFSNDTNLFTQSFAYGFTDELSAHISMGYGFDSNDTTTLSSGVTTSGAANGWTDPTFGVTYRILDQARHSPVDIDVTANYAPDLISDKATGGGHLGSIAPGRDVATLTGTVGREMRVFTVAGTATAEHYGVQEYTALSTNDTYKAGSFWDYTLGIKTETRFTQRASFELGLGYSLIGARNSTTNEASGITSTGEGANTLAVNTALNYSIIPNLLVAGLTYTYDDYSNTATDRVIATQNVGTQNHMQNVYGARLQYLFN